MFVDYRTVSPWIVGLIDDGCQIQWNLTIFGRFWVNREEPLLSWMHERPARVRQPRVPRALRGLNRFWNDFEIGDSSDDETSDEDYEPFEFGKNDIEWIKANITGHGPIQNFRSRKKGKSVGYVDISFSSGIESQGVQSSFSHCVHVGLFHGLETAIGAFFGVVGVETKGIVHGSCLGSGWLCCLQTRRDSCILDGWSKDSRVNHCRDTRVVVARMVNFMLI